MWKTAAAAACTERYSSTVLINKNEMNLFLFLPFNLLQADGK